MPKNIYSLLGKLLPDSGFESEEDLQELIRELGWKVEVRSPALHVKSAEGSRIVLGRTLDEPPMKPRAELRAALAGVILDEVVPPGGLELPEEEELEQAGSEEPDRCGGGMEAAKDEKEARDP